MMKVTLGRVIDHVLETDVNGRCAKFDWKDLIRFVAQTIQTVSEIQFGWDVSHGCTWITIINNSGPPGRKS